MTSTDNSSIKPKSEAIDLQDDLYQNKDQSVSETKEFPEPLIFCQFITDRPRTAFAITTCIYLLGMIVSGALVLAQFDLFPLRFAGVKFEVRAHRYLQQHRAFQFRTDAPGYLPRLEVGQQELFSNYYEVIFLTSNGSNILTQKHFKAISKIQKDIFNLENYDQFCLRNYDSKACEPPNSLVSIVEPIIPKFDNIPFTLFQAYRYPAFTMPMQQLLGKHSELNETSAFSHITRSQFRIGRPLNISEGRENDIKRGAMYLRKTVMPFLEKLSSNPPEGLQVYFFGESFLQEEIERLTMVDMCLAIGSFLFIFILLCVQTSSLWLGFCGVFAIIGSFVMANLVYRLILGFVYFGILHVLSIFVILGIGADDVFVFVDTWRHYSIKDFPSEAHRLSHVYRQASVATAQTSLTTIVAFLASAISPLLIISSFGVFSALLVLFTYASVITFFPTALYFGSTIFKSKFLDCRRGRNQVSPEKSEQSSPGLACRFFRDHFFRFITHKIWKWCIIVFFVGLSAGASAISFTLAPEDRQIKILSPHSNIEKANTFRLHSFRSPPPDASVFVTLVWGLKPQDMSSCEFRKDDECEGHLRVDNSFNMNSAEAQLGLRNICNTLNHPSNDTIRKLRMRVNPVTNVPSVKCFLRDMEKFLHKKLGMTLPLNKTNVLPFMKSHPHIYNLTNLSPTFDNYFEVMLTYWITNGYAAVRDSNKTARDYAAIKRRASQMKSNQTEVKRSKTGSTTKNSASQSSPNPLTFDKFVGEVKTNETRFIDINGTRSFWGAKLLFMSVEIELDLNFHLLGYPEGLAVASEWDEFVENQMKYMPKTANKAFQESLKWPGLVILKSMAENAVQGILIGIGTSLLILTCTTLNVIVAFMATGTIALVTNGVVACIVLADWKLGPLESINLCLVVGLAVDYVVHLAEAYNRSIHSDRLNRLRDALEQVGVSVLSGAITSLGASVFMIFANIIFFVQFGIFMFCTIGLSFIFSTCFFCTLIGICGPEGNIGSLKVIRELFSKCISRQVKSVKSATKDISSCSMTCPTNPS